MPWTPVKLVPGLNAELTPTALQAGYTEATLGRFQDGMFQKLGGWTKYYPISLDVTTRFMHVYQDLDNDDRLTIGAEEALYDFTSGVLSNISPQQTQTSVTTSFDTSIGSPTVTIDDNEVGTVTTYDAVTFLTPVAVGGLILQGTYQIAAYVSATSYTITASSDATGNVTNGGAVPTFTTTSGSSTVTVGLVAHGLSAGDEVVLDVSTTVGGVAIYGRYTVQTAPTADTFTITTSTTASSGAGPTSMNSGETAFLYHITAGPQATGGAYGAGLYGAGLYGKGSSLNASAGTGITATDWSLSNWGELLIANPENGGIYWWGQNTGYQNCQLLQGGPLYNTGSFVSISEQAVIAYGSTTIASIGVYHDPLLVRWCNTGDFFTWSSLATYRIPTGSKCVGGAATPQRNLIWTDIDLWSVDYIGAQFGYGFNKIGANCGLIAKHAHAQLGANVYWMGSSNFFVLSGAGVSILPCSVWDIVFQDLDSSYTDFCFSASNSAFSEIWFFYPSASGGYGYCDRYVKLNTRTGEWDAGPLQRNAWIDKTVLSNPVAVNNTGTIYYHESGNDADNVAMEPAMETGWFFLNEGQDVAFLDRIYPDFKWGEWNGSEDATLQVTVKAVMYPGDTATEYGPYTVTKSSQYISKRIRARHLKLRITSDDPGSFWRLGYVRVHWQTDGRR